MIVLEVLFRRFPPQCSVLPMVVVPLIITVEDHLGMIDGFKFKPFYYFTLNIAVQGFDIGILLRSGHMGKLLVDPFLL